MIMIVRICEMDNNCLNIKNILVILAGGKGKRFCSSVPKQYVKVNGKELLQYSIEEMKQSSETDRIIVVANNDVESINRIKENYGVDVIVGGKERAYSFQNAIDYVKNSFPKCKKIIFHEAARPLITHTIIDRYFVLLDEYDYVMSCKKISDSLGSHIIKSPRREDYFLIQAPEAYRFSVLNQYYNCESDIYFAANQFPDFLKGFQYYDIEYNIKLTTPADKAMIEYLLKERCSEM